jgi:hypothetical protein
LTTTFGACTLFDMSPTSVGNGKWRTAPVGGCTNVARQHADTQTAIVHQHNGGPVCGLTECHEHLPLCWCTLDAELSVFSESLLNGLIGNPAKFSELSQG